MNLLYLLQSSVGQNIKKFTAMMLTLSFAAAYLLSPLGEFEKVYAEGDEGGVSSSESSEPSEPSGQEDPVETLPLAVTAQPQNVTVSAGETATFTVKATGTGLQYQWYYRKAGAKNWSIWNGHTTATTSAAANATWNLMKVYCKISDQAGSVISSNSATVSLRQPLTLLTQPRNITVSVGEKGTFSVSAQGTGKLSYQWYVRKAGAKTGTLWKGHTSATTSATANATWNLMKVWCVITDEAGQSAQSDAATVTVTQPLTVLSQPKDVTVKPGDTAKFSVSAQGTGEISCQWYYKKFGAENWTLWKGHTAAVTSAAANATWNLMQVYCQLSDEAGSTVDSQPALIKVEQPLTIVTNPAPKTVTAGRTAEFTVKPQGMGEYSYQWYRRLTGDTAWSKWDGQTAAVLSFKAEETMNGMKVYCRVKDESGTTVNSSSTVLTVVPAIKITAQPGQAIKRTFTVKSGGATIYAGPGTNYKSLGTLKAGAKYLALEWGSDSNDVTWFRFNWNGKNAWISRKKTNVSDEFVTIADRSFKDGGVPIIYLSPSRQTHNAYAAGSTTEGAQMYRVGNALKKILEEEYLCVVYMPPVEMEISLANRPTDAYNKEADIYLAIHSNANSSGSSYGAVGYYFPASAQSKKLGENMANEMGKISPFTPTVRSKTVNGMTAFDNIGYGEVRDPAYFGMISLLAEVEYHDNADSARWIIDNPNKIARALANALEKTFDIQKK